MLNLIYTTVESIQHARKLAQEVLSEKLAVCVNIWDTGLSMYLWQNEIKHDKECYILFKTHASLSQELVNFISKHHPYEIPVILTWKADVNDEFAKFMQSAYEIN